MNQPTDAPQRFRGTLALSAIAAALITVFAPPASADEIADLKAQLQMLNQRISQLEQQQAAAPAATAAPAVVVKPTAPGVVPAPAALALQTDGNGLKLDQNNNTAVTLYDDANTRVKIYGLLEATLNRSNHQSDSGASANGFQVAWFSGNRLGFDIDHAMPSLGASLGMPDFKIISKLETEFELPTGNSDTVGVLFNRDAWLGAYSDTMGKLTFGRQNTLTRDFTQSWGDPYGTPQVTLKEGGYSNVNNFKQFIFYSAAATGTRANSAVVWKKDWDGHWVTGLMYAFGSGANGGSGDVGTGGSFPGDFTKGTTTEASLAYNHLRLGPVVMNANLSYDRANVSDLIHESVLFGGNIELADWRLNGGVVHYTAQQGAGGSAGDRRDHAWTVSASWRPGLSKTEFDLGFQEMNGDHAGFNAAGRTINPYGNTSGVTLFADGGKNTLYGSIIYHADRQTDFYVAADHFNVKGGWRVGDALGNGLSYGSGSSYSGETELALGARYKF